VPRFAIISLGLALLLAGCGNASEIETKGFSNLADYYSQEIAWESCPNEMFIDNDYFADGFEKNRAECAKVLVPASYSDLSLGVFSIQLMKDPAKVAGGDALFINPGGPGGSGVDMVQFLGVSKKMRENFDIIGFDPRGVKFSDEIRCDDDLDLRSYFEIDFYVDSDEEVAEYERFVDEYMADCVKKNPLWWTVNTENTVRDLDILRQVITGDKPLNFSGTSYGTTIAIEYLRLFSQNVGKFILDSPTENNVETIDAILRDVAAFDESFLRLFEKCAEDTACHAKSVDEVSQIIKSALLSADNGDLNGIFGLEESSNFKDKTKGSGALLFDGLFMMTYYPADEIYKDFRSALNQVKLLDYSVFEWYGFVYHGYDPETKARDNSDEIVEIVNCLDEDRRKFESREEILERQKQIAQVAPIYHFLTTPTNEYVYIPKQQGCDWTWLAFEDDSIANPPDSFLDPVNDTGRPVLIIASRNDNATPYSGAVNTAKFLKSPLITLEGDGHGVAYDGNECITKIIDDYLFNDVLPTGDVVCE
jgi:pimeloyl-ACP methyl ester carboxylesterase